MSECDGQCDDNNAVCPYCEHSWQVEQICDAMRDTDIPLTGENQECLARAILSRYNLEPKDD